MVKLGFCGAHKNLPLEVFENLLANPEVVIVGAFDADAEMLAKMEEKNGEIVQYTDYGQLLDEVDAIVIYNSPAFFTRLRQAMEAKVHIMYEFPQFSSEDDVNSLRKLLISYKGGKALETCFPRHYDVIFSSLAMMLPELEKEYGRVTKIAISTRVLQQKGKYDLFADRFIHDVDALDLWLGTGDALYEKVERKKKNYSIDGIFFRSNRDKVLVHLETFYAKLPSEAGVQIMLEFACGETATYRSFGMANHVSSVKCALFNKKFIEMATQMDCEISEWARVKTTKLLENVLAVSEMLR